MRTQFMFDLVFCYNLYPFTLHAITARTTIFLRAIDFYSRLLGIARATRTECRDLFFFFIVSWSRPRSECFALYRAMNE